MTDPAAYRTVFYPRHVGLEAKIIEYANWLMPLNYKTGVINEHLLTRRHAGLFDVSHMGRFAIEGKGALKFLQKFLTNNAQALRVLESQYTIIQDGDGFAIDDAYLYRFFKDEYLLVVNAGNRIKDFEYLKFHAEGSGNVKITDKTFETAMLGLQGPLSKEILQKAVSVKYLPEPVRNSLSIARVNPEVLISRTGYTGESLCFELFINNKDALLIWDLLVENGAAPVGLGARDTLRLEAGLPLYGHELGIGPDGNIPIFASALSQIAVSFSPLKDNFTGRDSLIRQFNALERIINKDFSSIDNLPGRIVSFVLQDKGIARHGDKVYFNEKYIGYVTSGTAVPYWETIGEGLDTKFTGEKGIRSIGLALIDSHTWEEDVVEIDVRGKKIKAVIIPYHLRSEAPPFAYPIIYSKEKKASFMRPQDKGQTYKNIQLLLQNTYKNTVWRQTECINLIPSEQTPSKMVRLLSVMDPAGRYAEHKKVKAFHDSEIFFYQGTGFISAVEQLLKKELVSYLGCREAETRPVSGQMANSIVFSALVDYLNRAYKKGEQKRLGYILNHHIIKGGHLSAQPMGALKDFVFIDPGTDKPAVIDFPAMKDNPYKIDMASCAKIIEEYKPGLIILGRSAMLNKEPVCQIRSILKQLDIDSLILYDMAHVLGLAGPYFQEPFEEGADIVTASTHKTFFGTQRGLIAANYQKPQPEYELWEAIERRTFPGGVSNHHPGTLLGLLMAAYEMNFFKDVYQQKVISNAKAFACALKYLGLDVAGDPGISFTETHQVIINIGYFRGPEIARMLEENNIIVNFQASPYDEGFTSSGCIRMGVNEMTRFGMEKKDFIELANLIFEAIVNKKNIRDKVIKFRKGFLDMQYCFDKKDFAVIMDKLNKLA